MPDREQNEGEDDTSVVEPPRSLIEALRRLLRPLVRALVHRQVQYPLLAQLIKSLYIDVVQSEFSLGGKAMTVSRLSLLTGIHRREAKRIQEGPSSSSEAAPRAVSLGAQILARWTSEERWLDGEGRPSPLPRSSESGADFQALVRSVSVDVHPRSVLDEWLRLGVAEMDAEDRVVLRTAAFVPTRGFDEKAHFVGRNLRDHMAAGFENLDAEESPHFERAVYYSDLPEDAVVELEAMARELGQRTLEQVNARALELKKAMQSTASTERRRRFTFGVYQYDAPVSDEDPEEQGGEDA